jgi:hypothetical protein
MYKCEEIGIPAFDNTLIYEVKGRKARVCYDNLDCKLQLFKEGSKNPIFSMIFPLMKWDEVREMGAHWILSGAKPTDKHAA